VPYINLQKRITRGLALLVGLMAFATASSAQQQLVPLKVMPLKGNIYWTQGGAGGNTGIIVGQNGVIVVDAKTTVDSSKEVQAEIAKITPRLVNTAIVTHSDGDHVNGLAGFPAGLTIIAQENCKKEMEVSAGTLGPAPQDRLPTKTIAKDEIMTIDGVRVRLLHWAPAHTIGDLVIYLPEQKVVFAGDLLVTNRPDTSIHAERGGTVAGWIESVKGMIDLDADTYVTGHGDLMTKDDVRKKLAFIQGKWDTVKTMVTQGKSLDDVKTAMGESTAPPVRNAQGNLPAASLTEILYKEVSKKG
jgi:glyoxylase-like metal-dependent hydrolase (beta-lactamase superfamily II)